jgi:hypothetical protein
MYPGIVRFHFITAISGDYAASGSEVLPTPISASHCLAGRCYGIPTGNDQVRNSVSLVHYTASNGVHLIFSPEATRCCDPRSVQGEYGQATRRGDRNSRVRGFTETAPSKPLLNGVVPAWLK